MSGDFYLTLVRHGETDANYNAIIQGSMDTQLNELGREQARDLARSPLFNVNQYTKIYCSDLRRAHLTCMLLLGEEELKDNPQVVLEPLLRERSFGVLEGRPLSMLVEASRAANKSLPDYVPYGGESMDDVDKRIIRFMETRILPNVTNGDDILVVTHGGVIRQLVLYFLKFIDDPSFDKRKCAKIPPNTSLNQFKIYYKNGKIVKIEFLKLHDISHLDTKVQQQALNQYQVNQF